MFIRKLVPQDYEVISPVVDDWWGRRPVRKLLPRLFFEHFSQTSFALIEASVLQAFLVGFRSQSNPEIAYIHFVGVSPTHRNKGYARALYNEFFNSVTALGCNEVQCITSPINKASVAFHQHMGFSITSNEGEENGFPVTLNYAGEGQHRVQFRKLLNRPA